MMICLLDEPTLIIFDSPDLPPDKLELIDVMNGEYSFCDDNGQRYVGVITQPEGWFRAAEYGLRPEGSPDIANALALVDRAVLIEPNERFPDLESLCRYLMSRRIQPDQR